MYDRLFLSRAMLPQGATYQITSCRALVSVCNGDSKTDGPPLPLKSIILEKRSLF